MNFPEPSKEVQEMKILHQDLFEIKRIQASLNQLPDGKLKTSLSQRVANYLSTGKTIDDLNQIIKDYQIEVKALESRIDTLERENVQMLEGREPVPDTYFIGFKSRWIIIAFIIGLCVATIVKTGY